MISFYLKYAINTENYKKRVVTTGPNMRISNVFSWILIKGFNIRNARYKHKKISDTDINFHSRTVHPHIIKVLLPTDAQENCFKRSIKIYINS